MAHFLTVLMLAIMMTTLKSEHLDVKGIKFMEKNNVRQIVSKWTTRYYISMTDFMAQTAELSQCKQKIMSLCKKLKNDSNCQYHEKFIETNERSIKHQYENIKNMAKQSKRGLLTPEKRCKLCEWISNLFSSNTDQDVVDKLHEATKENRKMENEHLDITNTTLFINKNAFHKINYRIQNLSYEIESIQNIQSIALLKIHLSNLIQISNSILFERYHLLSSLAQILNHDKTANIFDFIDADIFYRNLKNIESKLGESRAFPIPITNKTIFNIVKISDVLTTISTEHIRIEIIVPILNDNKFTHFEITPLPFQMNETMYIYETLAENILINQNNKSYALLSNHELQLCKTLQRKTLICTIQSPIFSGSSCEMDSLLHNNTKNCVSKEIPKHNYIIRYDENLFFIIPVVVTQITIECNNGFKQSILVNKIYEAKIENGCTLRNDDFEYVIGDKQMKDLAIGISNNFTHDMTFDFDDKIVKLYNHTILVNETDTNFANLTERLIELHRQTNKTPDRVVIPNRGNQLITLIAISSIGYVIIKICCAIKRK